MPQIAIVRTVADLRAQVAAWKRDGQRVALVPTMGALHDGHLSLITLAKTKADRVVASVFVNPTQFGPNEDFDAYPRNEERDADLLAGAGCDLLFAPTVGEMYAPGFATTVNVTGVSEPLDGAARPGHFAGVATVVSKLLMQCGPDVAVFGEKDYQQLQVIKRVVADLNIPTQIVGAPTSRLEDGLARSSRNAYLSAAEREIAGRLNLALADAVRRLQAGESVERVEATGLAALERAGFQRIDYFEVRNAEDLSHPGPGPLNIPARVLAAAVIGKTRLIDNMAV
ncbi:MAG: pantoate--beta-alanine ligase [Pseudomonadota bacterium]|uniref:pantoate--beta-alanine ligase n=1 Tax=unclassified Phenylobacterium TaxID=2640670 RepID=UPI0006FA6A1A|nr:MULTISPECIES: pantoate--beta-alanine ligase [unclassified Phenylobacterium]KRB44739.1 pantoate--beta-alanine ligase [Phenylobacterium sp. Root700]MBT9472245.1 pantoate--beta-alanine ligase [Phenylobacterium sp.]